LKIFNLIFVSDLLRWSIVTVQFIIRSPNALCQQSTELIQTHISTAHKVSQYE